MKNFLMFVMVISAMPLIAFSQGLNMSETKSLSRTQMLQAEQALRPLATPRTQMGEIANSAGFDGIDYKQDIQEALQALSRSGLPLPASQEWINSQGKTLLEQSSLLESAPLEDVRRLIGALERQERFQPGLIGDALLKGVYQQVHARVEKELKAASPL